MTEIKELEDSGLPVPNSLKQLLETQNVNYNVSWTSVDTASNRIWHDQHLRNVGAVKSLILQDKQGQLQVLIPADCLLDLKEVNRQLGRELRAMPRAALRRFFDKYQLQSIPALPKLTGLPTLVDSRLLEPEELLLDSGNSDQLLKLTQADFQQTLSDAEICDITVPLKELEKDHGKTDDVNQITCAVRNFTTLRVKQRLEETLELPPLPDSAQRIIKMRVDPNADISDLAAIVETDPSLAAQVVSWAASPYYSAPGKIKSIHDAIVRVLGFDMVLNLALGLALGKTLNIPKDGPEGTTSYWKMSVYTAAMVEGLVNSIPREHRPGFGLAYLSGLLSNFGYLILAEVFPPHFKTICRYIEANPHAHHRVIEQHILGISREQLSSWLMDLWYMPQEVVTALRFQNNPQCQGEHSEYAKLIYLARSLLRQAGIGTGPREEVPPLLFEELHLEREKAEAALASVIESSTELDNIAGQLA